MLCLCLGASTGTSVSLTSAVCGSLPPTCARPSDVWGPYLLDSTSAPLCAHRNPSDLCETNGILSHTVVRQECNSVSFGSFAVTLNTASGQRILCPKVCHENSSFSTDMETQTAGPERECCTTFTATASTLTT
ncbi:uncharacterized protein IWZ02DRAFT_430527 [Phyllosticta citriasiana]|uniref:uncharacterized protein n=1 Tax=Phyllosticta citriasiana TaxID=595635 RepID=UPI0030FD85BC